VSEKHPERAVAGRHPPNQPPRITPREKEILGLIAEGLTDQQIADRLWVSRGTVHTHQVHLREKLQVHNRVGLVREAMRLGLLSHAKSTVLWIGEEPRSGYTQSLETEPQRSPTLLSTESMGGEASADLQGETEMPNRTATLWYLAALLATGAQNGSAADKAAKSTRTPRASAPRAPVDADEKAAGMVARRVWAGPDVSLDGAPSPDGRYLSFVDWETGDLALRDLVTGKSRRLTIKGPWHHSYEFAVSSTISPEGKQVAYVWWNKDGFYDLRLIGLDGSRPRTLYRNADLRYIRLDGWSKDGKQILAAFFPKDGTSQIVLVAVADGSARVLKTLDRRYPKKLSLSPDGRTIAYDYPPQADSPERDIFLLATDGSRDAPLVQHPGEDVYPLWAPDGQRILFASDRTGSFGAWVVRIADGKPQGAPELVKREMGAMSPLGFDRKGSLYFGLQAGIVDVYTATLDPATGRVLVPPQLANPRLIGANSAPVWSPDGRYLAYLSPERNALRGRVHESARIVTIRSVESGETRELALKQSIRIVQPSWSPDGRSLLANDSDSRGGLFRIDAQTGALTMVSRWAGYHAVWTPDGRSIFYLAGGAINTRDLETGQEKELYRGGAWKCLALSPDGRLLAFVTEEMGTPSYVVKVIPAVGGEPRELLRVKEPERITTVTWMPDGRQLLFGRENGTAAQKQATAVWRIPVAGGAPQRLGLTMNALRHLRVHPDGRQIAFTAGSPEAEVWVMENFLPPAQSAQAPAPRR
jgi:Tol biopolymer transport system component/DNA-binding CsgD family transcriptional regulator